MEGLSGVFFLTNQFTLGSLWEKDEMPYSCLEILIKRGIQIWDLMKV